MNRRWPFRTRGRMVALIAVVVLTATAIVVTRLPRRAAKTQAVSTENVERRTIAVSVEATGTVEPINLVEVKSKASGQITRMPVEIGSVVDAGDLLVQVDPRDVRNAFDQAQAALVAAEARAHIARGQRKRSDDLFREQVITASEHEAAMLDDANAQSQLVAARTNLDLARQRLEDATVRAPIAGTILEKPVSVGQVISSATSSVSGGTTLLKMADLSRIRMRALVVETDIGKVREGQDVQVVVDAYPQRSFPGVVEKIEPQALVQQSVTMFPVLVSISNEEGMLLPGMNGEVTMLVQERTDVLTVSLDALRGMREMAALAPSLGFDADSLRAQVRAAAGSGPAAARGAPGDSSFLVRRGGRPDSTTVRRGRPGGRDGRPMDPERAARLRQRMAERGGPGAGREPGSGAWLGAGGGARSEGVGGDRLAFAGFGGAGGAGGGARSRMQIAVVKTAKGFAPRIVRTGLSNYDYTEILEGLEEGEEVVLLSVLEIQSQRDQRVSRVRDRFGGGMTGGSSSGGTRRGGGR